MNTKEDIEIQNKIANIARNSIKINEYISPKTTTGDVIIKLNENSKSLLDYITNLQQENEFLKLNNPEMNIEHFRVVKENKVKIDRLRKENEQLKEKINNLEMFKYNIPNDKTKTVSTITKSYKNEYEDYKSRCEKALNWTKRIIGIIIQQPSEDDTWILENLHSIEYLLQGSDEK